MKPNRIISALSLFATMAALCAALPELSEGNKSNVTQSDPLLSWNEGWRSKPSWTLFRGTSDQGSPKFVPPEERIATFDQDGTLLRKGLGYGEK